MPIFVYKRLFKIKKNLKCYSENFGIKNTLKAVKNISLFVF